MSLEAKKQSRREIGARHLFNLVCQYINESYEKSEVLKRELYFKKRSEWFQFVYRNNSKKSRLVEFDRGAFQRLVDKKYIEYTKTFHPEISLLKVMLLKTKTHSYA
jgi:hypothetical protein